MSYYDTLGVRTDATLEEIKQSYRRLAVKHHPDKTDGGEDTQFKQITHAYGILSDTDTRTEYNTQIGIDRNRLKQLHNTVFSYRYNVTLSMY